MLLGLTPLSALQNVALDQRIARVLGNLDKVVKDPTRGGGLLPLSLAWLDSMN